MERRIFLNLAGSLLVYSPFIKASWIKGGGKNIPLFIDADTANEIDDLYAITRALLEPDFNILGLSSAQWFHHISPRETAQESQRLNEDILRLLKRQDIPHPKGSEMIIGKPWGGIEPRDSPAAQLMIKKALEIPSGERLTIANLGAVTNVASAIQIAPDIIPKIAVYCLSGKYFPESNIWDKDEFNARRDLNALNLLFNTKELEFHVMPVNILYDFRFKQQVILEKFSGKGGIWDFLAARWLTHAAQNKERIMWDLALIEALAHPDMARQKEVSTPPENVQRKIHVYTSIDISRMMADWWKVIDKNF